MASEAGIRVIEDCAQAHGARYRDRIVGTMGDLGCFSFYPTKNLGAIGDGGAVIGNDEALLDRIRRLRQYGWTPESRYVSQEEGINSRLDEMQAAILRVKLAHLNSWNLRRQSLAAAYDQLLPETVVKPVRSSGTDHVYHLYVVRTSQRDRLMADLKEVGIGSGIHYPVPVHMMPAYSEVARMPTPLPETERLVNEIVSLPMHPMLSDADVERVALAVTDSLA
jgi:dTDP-4-amino-4,6-dideoxygalactose transaminase